VQLIEFFDSAIPLLKVPKDSLIFNEFPVELRDFRIELLLPERKRSFFLSLFYPQPPKGGFSKEINFKVPFRGFKGEAYE
jgi:hypothetical protein